jgi:hypothetical protein
VWRYGAGPQMGYSFSVIHALAYSFIGAQTLYLGTHWNPIYWDTACLVVNSGSLEDAVDEDGEALYDNDDEESTENKKKATSTDYGKIAKALSDIIEAGINVSLIDINNSDFGFKPDVKNNRILFGMKALLNVNDDLVNTIIENRPYYNIKDFSKLVSFIDDNYNWYTLYTKGQVIKKLKVNLSKTDYYNITVSKDITKFLPKDYDKSKITYDYDSYIDLSYRTKKGTKIGHIKYIYDKEEIYEEDIYLNEELKISIKKVLNHYKVFIISIFIIFIIIILLSKIKRQLKRKKIVN